MTTVNRSQVATARDAGDGFAVGRQMLQRGTVILAVLKYVTLAQPLDAQK